MANHTRQVEYPELLGQPCDNRVPGVVERPAFDARSVAGFAEERVKRLR
ncbi:hypothetical protein HHL21_13655 [Massilia sp. RP-1-19]|uniref:Uncharacterized protein n=1 Tax=Massilia polaris TaxID=2728846 RepID=A0A848HLK5_9BURK|nr:hypothetical protein [Massilia polaris]NML62104.1 hypothetical protein [Massilia polaris]